MDASSLSQFVSLCNDKKKDWCATSIVVPAILTDTSGQSTACEINLANFLGPTSEYGLQIKSNPILRAQGYRRPHVFPDITDDSVESRKAITRHLVDSCAKGGFEIACNGYQSNQRILPFYCAQGYIYKNAKKVSTNDGVENSYNFELENLNDAILHTHSPG